VPFTVGGVPTRSGQTVRTRLREVVVLAVRHYGKPPEDITEEDLKTVAVVVDMVRRHGGHDRVRQAELDAYLRAVWPIKGVPTTQDRVRLFNTVHATRRHAAGAQSVAANTGGRPPFASWLIAPGETKTYQMLAAELHTLLSTEVPSPQEQLALADLLKPLQGKPDVAYRLRQLYWEVYGKYPDHVLPEDHLSWPWVSGAMNPDGEPHRRFTQYTTALREALTVATDRDRRDVRITLATHPGDRKHNNWGHSWIEIELPAARSDGFPTPNGPAWSWPAVIWPGGNFLPSVATRVWCATTST
jgi:hypothetical protein